MGLIELEGKDSNNLRATRQDYPDKFLPKYGFLSLAPAMSHRELRVVRSPISAKGVLGFVYPTEHEVSILPGEDPRWKRLAAGNRQAEGVGEIVLDLGGGWRKVLRTRGGRRL